LQVRAGAEVSNDELVRFASLFNDELTLDNLDRVQLVSMCQLLSIPPFGTDGFLRNRLRSQLDGIKQVTLCMTGTHQVAVLLLLVGCCLKSQDVCSMSPVNAQVSCVKSRLSMVKSCEYAAFHNLHTLQASACKPASVQRM
jgi:hypothetical protein